MHNDIHVLMRNGPEMDTPLRETIFSMAQYMIQHELCSLSFDGVSRPFTVAMATDMKMGRHATATGFIFRAHIEWGSGEKTETLFLARYRADWREKFVKSWEENIESYGLGGDPKEIWKN